MKKTILLILIAFATYSCGNKSGDSKDADADVSSYSNTTSESETSINDTDKTLKTNTSSELNDLFNIGKSLIESSESNDEVNFQLDTEMLIDMLVQSGVSRESLEKLINNPDSLKVLAERAMKEQGNTIAYEPVQKGKISKEQLTSQKTPTGVSLEEAILIVQAESGPEATMAKLKKIDSLAGTNMMSQLDLTEAGYVMGDIERKNEIPVSIEENKKITAYRNKSMHMHSEKESKEFLAELEETEKDIASGKLKASPRFQRAIENRKKSVVIFHKDILRKSEAAKQKFKKLNPDLFYGDEVGVSYVGHRKTTVYLPLGPLSFADEVVNVNHPKLLTQNVKNVLGEPDVIITYDDATGDYSLGLGGTLTIRFIDNALVDVNGPDLYLFEVGEIEPTDLEISKDGKSWVKIGKIDGGVAEVDIAPFVKPNELFYYVRFKDLEGKSGIPGADIDAVAAIGSAMRLNLDSQVLFDSGKSELKPKGMDALKALVNSIIVLKKGKVIVEGHTDDVGSEATNHALSLARAKSVSKALKQLIPSSQFKWQEKGYGESKPLVDNDSDINRSKNRRVEILVVPN
ncbi:OmpA family protein [Winogradskyella bathintestinalis]|uniref:OmpA family protein n=1 Tax=Winogradskyella bathintestinalis TaxID=3035208 RepID=A0ABT7ZWZ2_9FLAO|nr:OmpA family protein [Winogradskyella bathintestinalis]MDN3493451.1 OmpA family protein [Winogradskyella bathintestinalis]